MGHIPLSRPSHLAQGTCRKGEDEWKHLNGKKFFYRVVVIWGNHDIMGHDIMVQG